MDDTLGVIDSASYLCRLIQESINLNNTCDINPTTILDHKQCFPSIQESDPLPYPKAHCPQGLLHLIIKCVALKPSHVDDDVRDAISDYLKRRHVKARGLLDLEILTTLQTSSASKTMIWLKYEGILKRLIKDHLYPTEIMADEVLRTVKNELDPALAASLASLLGSCVSTCREASQNDSANHGLEEEGKWCEIIDWMSWFLSNNETDDLDQF